MHNTPIGVQELKCSRWLFGFTLAELLVTLMIFSFLSLITIAFYSGFQSRQFVSLKAWEVKRSLELARSIAITQRKKIKLCMAIDYHCVAINGTQLLIFSDDNANHQWSQDERIYRNISLDGITIKLSASGRKFIRFKPTGESMESGNFLICDSDKSDYAKQVIVYLTGSIRFSKDINLDGYDDKKGRSIICPYG